jgi:hypothetical protein
VLGTDVRRCSSSNRPLQGLDTLFPDQASWDRDTVSDGGFPLPRLKLRASVRELFRSRPKLVAAETVEWAGLMRLRSSALVPVLRSGGRTRECLGGQP